MAVQITFTIQNQYIARIVAALNIKYLELVPPGTDTSGMTNPQIAKEAIRRWVINSVKETEHRTAVKDIVIDVPDEIIEGEIQ